MNRAPVLMMQRHHYPAAVSTLLQLAATDEMKLEDPPKLPPGVDRESPSPIPEPARNIESQNIEQNEPAESDRRKPPTWQ